LNMPDNFLLPQKMDSILITLIIVLLVCWISMTITSYLLWSNYNRTPTIICNDIEGCKDVCGTLRIGGLVHAVSSTLSLLFMVIWFIFISLDFNRLMTYAAILFLVGFFYLIWQFRFCFFFRDYVLYAISLLSALQGCG